MNIYIYNRFSPVLILASLICLFNISCKNTENKNWKNYVISTINHWKGKEIIFPDSVNYSEKLKDFSDIKIATYVDATCGVCLNSLVFWNNFIEELKGIKINIYVFVHTEDHNILMNETIESLRLNYPIVVDNKNKYIELNNLYDTRFQTVLLDRNNKVVLIGDPVLNSNFRKLFVETILEFNKSKTF